MAYKVNILETLQFQIVLNLHIETLVNKTSFFLHNFELCQFTLFLHFPVSKNSSILSSARFAIAIRVSLVALPR